jgi:exonuclease SbcD
VPAASLPAGIHYLALGHIHRPQAVAAPSPARFAGSPLALDFGETRQEKSIVLVEVKAANAPAHIETIGLSAGRALRDVRGTLDELAALAPDCGDDHLRVFVTVDEPVPGLADQVRKLLPNAVQVHLDAGHVDVDGGDRRLGRLAPGLDPAELYAGYYRRKRNAEPSPELAALFRELMTEAMSDRES